MRALVLSCGVWCVLASAAAGRDVFVDNVAGDDRFDGSSPRTMGGNGPCRTISRALRAAEKGDRVIIANTGQPYFECVTLHGGRNSGYPGRPFVIEGNGATLAGLAPVPEEGWRPFTNEVARFWPYRKAFQQLYRDGLPLPQRPASDAGPLPELAPLEWCLFRGAVYFRPEAGLLPTDYRLEFAVHPVGLTLYEVRHVVVAGLVIQGYQLDGVNAHDNAFDVALVGLNCRGNGRSGISVGGASRVIIDSCLVGNNGAAQVRTEGYCRVRIVNSDLLGNTAPPLVQEGGDVIVEAPAGDPAP
jgi:antitoxin (DNA-binding transcriptional repressor) of toxin-antitoxin stability system